MDHVLLIGFMGAGKSTVGGLLASRLDRPFLDMDRDIEWHEGRPIPEIFAEGGEVAFREAERAAVTRLECVDPSVVACGGGVILDARNRDSLREAGTVVYLHVSADEALRRVGANSDRPLLAGATLASAERLLESREALYRATADLVVETGARTADRVAAELAEKLGAPS